MKSFALRFPIHQAEAKQIPIQPMLCDTNQKRKALHFEEAESRNLTIVIENHPGGLEYAECLGVLPPIARKAVEEALCTNARG
jgi:hypothetical protein